MKVLVTKEYLTNIANSIRNKKGNTTKYKPENMSEIVKQVSIELGKPMRAVLVDNNEEAVAKTDSYSDIAKSLDMPINIIE